MLFKIGLILLVIVTFIQIYMLKKEFKMFNKGKEDEKN